MLNILRAFMFNNFMIYNISNCLINNEPLFISYYASTSIFFHFLT